MKNTQEASTGRKVTVAAAGVALAVIAFNQLNKAEASNALKREALALQESNLKMSTVILGEGVALRSEPVMLNDKADGRTNVIERVEEGKKLAFVNPLEYVDDNNDTWLGATIPGAKPTDIRDRADKTVWVNYSQLQGQNKIETVNFDSPSTAIDIAENGTIVNSENGDSFSKVALSVDFNEGALKQLIEAGLAQPIDKA